MINATGLRWILTALFVLPALHALWSTTRPGRTLPHRVGHLLHAVMGAAMAAMAWPWGMDLPTGPQIVLFSVGALWFAAAAAFRPPGTDSLRAGLFVAVPHVVMMLAMAWMVAVMDGSGMASGGSGGGHHDMAGMDMSGSGSLGMMSLSGVGQQWTAGLLAAVLAAFGLLWLAQAFDRGREGVPSAGGTAVPLREEAAEPACHAAMAVGMAVMFVLLL
ncbi:DUF5134 domain-containing protein [Streptomyces sp. AD681]|uniref:DUF5134 domain-containing protein n=1 Tax=Streptomyces sp. AD681 TaxID=3019069 RepID=UPI0022F1D443|nr:DUF5134 domain-containing protein [Streptomyces sp. AD681]MDA5141684.1 DUF5134 domain-containing protein [Streptomyces sp. AD681]